MDKVTPKIIGWEIKYASLARGTHKIQRLGL
jgi:hypothetical protein